MWAEIVTYICMKPKLANVVYDEIAIEREYVADLEKKNAQMASQIKAQSSAIRTLIHELEVERLKRQILKGAAYYD